MGLNLTTTNDTNTDIEQPVAAEFATYVANNAPSLAITLDGIARKFENKQLVLSVVDDAAAIAELDKAIATKPSISQIVVKVDKEKAAAVAKAHHEAMLKRDAAVLGGMTAGHVAQLNNKQRLEARDIEFAKQGVDITKMQEQSDTIRKDDLMFTEKAAAVAVSPTAPIKVSV